MAPPDRILAVDLYGTAVVFEEFGRVIAPGGAALVISSMAGYMLPPLPPEQDQALANTPADDLRALPFLQPSQAAKRVTGSKESRGEGWGGTVLSCHQQEHGQTTLRQLEAELDLAQKRLSLRMKCH